MFSVVDVFCAGGGLGVGLGFGVGLGGDVVDVVRGVVVAVVVPHNLLGYVVISKIPH